MKLTAEKSFTYGGKRYAPGDPIEAKPRDARLLLAIGRARVLVEPVAETVVNEPSLDEKPKRKYKRRDLKAED